MKIHVAATASALQRGGRTEGPKTDAVNIFSVRNRLTVACSVAFVTSHAMQTNVRVKTYWSNMGLTSVEIGAYPSLLAVSPQVTKL